MLLLQQRVLAAAPAAVGVASRRLFAAAAAAAAVAGPPRREQITVPCRSNGAVKVDIFHAPTPSAPVLIYLPSGPVIPEHGEEEERLVTALAAASQSTIARINYRFSPEHGWPTPLHDVLVGYDWVFENLLHDQPKLARLGICGELAGGSLATTLALTECQRGQSRIVAAAVNNPIADWLFPDDLPIEEPAQLPEPHAPEETSFPADQDMMTWWAQQEQDEKEERDKRAKAQKKQKRAPKPPPPTAWVSNGDNPIIPALSLSGERDVLFTNPEHLFDRFASPIHFFRSPHGKLIYPQSDHVMASSSPSDLPRDPHDFETQMDISHYQSFEASKTTPEVPLLVRCRSYARIYPPADSPLALPQWHLTSGSQSPLLDQASDLSRVLKRSIARHELRGRTARVMWKDPVEKAKYEAWADQRVHLNHPAGVGLWTLSDNPDWTNQVEEVGRWMSSRLSPESI